MQHRTRHGTEERRPSRIDEQRRLRHAGRALALFVVLAVAASCGQSSGVDGDGVLDEMISPDQATLDPHYDGSNPGPYVQQFAEAGTYFDPWTPTRLDGTAIEQHLMSFEGLIPLSLYEIVNSAVDVEGETAVFTFNLVTYDPDRDEVTSRWNATEVRRLVDEGWTLVHAHWSPTEPVLEATG